MHNVERTLRNMLNDLSSHHRDKSELLTHYVNSRLDKSLKNYYEELMQTYDYLTRRDAERVLKRALKEEKK